MPEWILDEGAHAGPEHLDAAYVAMYERKAGYDPTDDVDVLIDYGLNPDSVVLDMGAGTGVFAAAVAPRCREVIAVDISPAMTAALRARVRAEGMENVRVVEAGFLSYAHEGEPVDFVFTRNALHHIPDFWKAIALLRLASSVRPGGVLRIRDIVFDFDPGDAAAVFETWFARAVRDPAVGFTAEELANHVRTEFSTCSWLLEPMIERAGLSIDDRVFRGSVYGAYTCIRR